jgi:hypothetical protein
MLKHVSFALWPLLTALLLFAVGCGPPWIVVAQARPNPFIAHTQFSVEPVHMENLTIGEKSEAAWLSEKDGEQRVSWRMDKEALAARFLGHLTSGVPELRMIPGPPPDGQTFIIRPTVSFIEPGFYAVVASGATRVRMTLQILSTAGMILDEIKIEVAIQASLTNPSIGGRVRDAADRLGEIAARYLRKRTSGEED